MDADDRRALVGSIALMALGSALIAIALWLFTADLQRHIEPAPGPPATAPTGAGAPAWAHTCNGTAEEWGCPLP